MSFLHEELVAFTRLALGGRGTPIKAQRASLTLKVSTITFLFSEDEEEEEEDIRIVLLTSGNFSWMIAGVRSSLIK